MDNKELFEPITHSEVLSDLNQSKVEDLTVNTGLDKDDIFRPLSVESISESEGEEITEERKQEPESEGEGKPTGEGEARMLITVLDMLFCRVDDAIAGTSNPARWKIDQQDKDDLIEIGALLSADGKRLANPTLLFWISMIVIFLGKTWLAYKYRKGGNKESNETVIEEEPKVIYVKEKPKRKKFVVDENGMYIYSLGNQYLKKDARTEIMEFKDYDSLIEVNDKSMIDKLFNTANASETE
jgi:hypothetical protein